MKTEQAAPKDIDDYIAAFPNDIRQILKKIRATVRKAAPRAEERISYRIPCFALHGNLVYFAAFKRHIGFFPTASGIANFKQELSSYKCSRGTVQFPFDKPIPYGLIGKIVRFRVKENLEKAEAKRKKK